jgi:hypothetical protein
MPAWRQNRTYSPRDNRPVNLSLQQKFPRKSADVVLGYAQVEPVQPTCTTEFSFSLSASRMNRA